MTGLSFQDRRFGIYEKALPALPWPQLLEQAEAAGYDFVEMSIDESDERLARLDWDADERRSLVAACQRSAVPVHSICLSAHRRYGLGSRDPVVRARASQILRSAVMLAADIGARVIQVAGYHAYYEPPDPEARARYVAGLEEGLESAAGWGVMLAVENIDTADTASADDVISLLEQLRSPWFQAYPDVGNFAVHGLDVLANAARVVPWAVGFHLKDARRGEPRRVPFGKGVVPFREVFKVLASEGYLGPFTVEMWNDDARTATAGAAASLEWMKKLLPHDATRPFPVGHGLP